MVEEVIESPRDETPEEKRERRRKERERAAKRGKPEKMDDAPPSDDKAEKFNIKEAERIAKKKERQDKIAARKARKAARNPVPGMPVYPKPEDDEEIK